MSMKNAVGGGIRKQRLHYFLVSLKTMYGIWNKAFSEISE
jgi:hypothetical protein